MPTRKDMDAAVAAERARCIAILEAELERGRGLLGLCDMRGLPIFNEETTIAGMEAIQHCIELLRKKTDQR